MGESSDRRVPRVYFHLMVAGNNKNLNTSTLLLAKFLSGTTPASDHTSDNGLNLTEDALSLGLARIFLAFLCSTSSPPDGTLVDATDFTEMELGARFTLADITAAFVIFLSVPYSADALLRVRHRNTLRHLDFTVQLKLKEAFGQPTLVEKAVWYIPPGKPKKAEEDGKKDMNVVPEESKPMISYCHRHPISSTARWFSVALRKESFSIYLIDVKHDKALTLVFILSDQIGSFFNSSGGSMPIHEVRLDYGNYNYKKSEVEDFEDIFFEGALAWDLQHLYQSFDENSIRASIYPAVQSSSRTAGTAPPGKM
ncbi:hypothetical protein EDC04DRAFT_3144044 [Pisolithus marmoratus]|nr:hypothetical protein EDC04DRAFT_3144044 [Pisolithus marmoratus]